MSEARIQAEIRLALGSLGMVFWRNNTGVFRDGGRFVRFGLAVGSADLIGIVEGRFCALEVKQPGKRATIEQAKWLKVVRLYGGFGAVVTSVQEALEAVERCRDGGCE